MRSGGETLSSIEEALRDVKARESDLKHDLEDANRSLGELQADRLEELHELALRQARDAASDGVIDEGDDLAEEVRTILQARLKTIGELERRDQEAEAAREKHRAGLDALAKRIGELEDNLDKFAEAARAALAVDQTYKHVVDQHESMAEVYLKAKEKAEQVARDEDEKGAPYRGDPLFMYLWKRKYGTAEYGGTGLIRVLDGWVAGLVRFSDARANYAMLTEITRRLGLHAEDLRQQKEAVQAQLDEMEVLKTRELAGGDLDAELKAERERQALQIKELEAINSELTETGRQLTLYARGEDPSFRSAVGRHASLLERVDLPSLVAGASQTEASEDDRIVARLAHLDKEIEQIEQSINAKRKELQELFDKKQELARIATNFRRRHYDDVGSEFGGKLELDELLENLLKGVITGAEYWARTQSRQQWRHRPADPWRRQSGLPPFGRFPGQPTRGGTWAGPGRGGSRGGDDFRTGGSF